MQNACSIPETCRRLGISRTTLYSIIRDGGLPARKLGKRTIVLTADIEAFLNALPTLK